MMIKVKKMQTIANKIGGSELQKLYDEGKKYGVVEMMQDIWTVDLDHQKREFSHDQASNSELIVIACMYFLVMVGEEITAATIRMGKLPNFIANN